MQNCLMALELPALCQISFHICRVEVIQRIIILGVRICLLSLLLLPTHYNNREKPLLCRCHIDDDIVIALNHIFCVCNGQ
jgi:hypothetical protein